MTKVRLRRQSIEQVQAGVEHPLAAVRHRIVVNGKPIPLNHVDEIENLGEILSVVQSRANAQRDPVAYLNQVRPFLECCSRFGYINLTSVEAYKRQIRGDESQGQNTKAMNFGQALNLCSYLFSSNVIPHFDVPENFKMIEAVPKANLYDVSPVVWERASERVKSLAFERFNAADLGQDVALVAAVIASRLEAVRRAAKSEIAEIHADFTETRSLIEASMKSGRFCELRSLREFPKEACEGDAIVWTIAKYGARLPSSQFCDQSFYNFVKRKLGGFGRLQRRIAASIDTLAPFLALQLCEHALAPNVDGVTRYTYRNCLGPGESNATQVFSFGKWRGEPQEISRELARGRPGEWSLPRAIEFLHDYTAPLLDGHLPIDPRIDENEGRCLYIHYDKIHNKWVTHIDAGSVNYTLRRFLNRAAKAEIELIPIVERVRADSFRPSIALLDRLEGQSIFQTQRLLAHSAPATTARYTDRQSVSSVNPLKELQFQRYMAEKIAGAQREIPTDAVPVGNGFYCTDPSSGGPRRETNGGVCTSHDLCDRSCVSSVLVVEDPQSIAQWIAWRTHIELGRTRLETANPGRWAFWQMRDALYKVLLEKSSARARRLAESLVARVAETLPPLV